MEHAVADEETAPTAHGRAISSWAYPVAVGVLLVLAFAIRIYRLEYQSIWWDESYTILTSKKGLVDILGDIGIYDVHPPLFHYALHFWMILAGSSEFGARFLSVAGGMLLVAFAIRAGQTMGNRGVALAAGLLAAVMPAWVAYSQEVRMYAFSIPLSLGSAYAFFFLVRNLRAAPGSGEREAGFALPSRRLWIGYVAVTLLAVYADYFPIYVVLFENLWMVSFLVLSTRRLPQQRGRILRLALTWAASQLVLLLLYLPWLVAALHYGIGTPLVNLAYASPPSPLSRLAGMWQGMTLGRKGPAGENVLPLATLAAVLLVGLVAAWLKRRRRDVGPDIVAFLASYFLAVCALFFASLQIWPFFHPRYILIATPPLLLLLAISIERLWRTQAIFGLTAGGLVVFFLASASRGYLFDPNLAKQDARGFVSYLNREVTSDDLVVWATRHPFPYYYRGQAPAVWLSTNPTTTLQELTELIRGHKRIFWSSWTDFPEDPWGLVPYLLGSSSTRVEKIQFRGYSATRYDLRPDASLAPVDLKPTSINFDNNVVLTGMEIRNAPAVAISSSEPIRVAMRWQSLAPINKRFKYYIYLRDEEQHLLGQYDGLILDDNQGTTAQWSVGDTGWSFAALRPFAGVPVGDYTLELGVYDDKEMKHLPVVGLTTPPVLGKIRLERPATPPAIADLGMQKQLGQDFSDVRLLGYSLADASLEGATLGLSAKPGQILRLTLFWQATAKPARDQSFCIRLLSAGRTSAEQCGQPTAGRYATSQWQPGEIVRDIRELVVPPDAPNGEMSFVLASEAGEAPLASVRLTDREHTFTTPTIGRPRQFMLGQEIDLLGYDLTEAGGQPAPDGSPLTVAPGDTIELTLYWRAKARIPTAYTVFTHILDEGGGKVLAQMDSPPLGGKAPTTSWEVGEVLVDRYLLQTEKKMPPGDYPLEIGMYDPLTMKRAPTGSAGDSILLDKVRVR